MPPNLQERTGIFAHLPFRGKVQKYPWLQCRVPTAYETLRGAWTADEDFEQNLHDLWMTGLSCRHSPATCRAICRCRVGGPMESTKETSCWWSMWKRTENPPTRNQYVLLDPVIGRTSPVGGTSANPSFDRVRETPMGTSNLLRSLSADRLIMRTSYAMALGFRIPGYKFEIPQLSGFLRAQWVGIRFLCLHVAACLDHSLMTGASELG